MFFGSRNELRKEGKTFCIWQLKNHAFGNLIFQHPGFYIQQF